MSKVTSAFDELTKKWVTNVSVNNKVLITASGPADMVGERDCLIRLVEILSEKLESVMALCSTPAVAGLPEVR